MPIEGFDNLTEARREAERSAGGRFVVYEICISFVILTLRRRTRVRFLRAGESGLWQGLPYTALSLVLGWWGVPWGVYHTPLVVWTNLCGGHDVTAQVRGSAHALPPESESSR